MLAACQLPHGFLVIASRHTYIRRVGKDDEPIVVPVPELQQRVIFGIVINCIQNKVRE